MANATVVICQMAVLAERRFRRLDAPQKLAEVYFGSGIGELQEGTEVEQEEVLAAA